MYHITVWLGLKFMELRVKCHSFRGLRPIHEITNLKDHNIVATVTSYL